MSAYIVDDATIGRILDGIAFSAHVREVNEFYAITRQTSISAQCMNEVGKYYQEFAQKMHELNVRAVNGRYPHHPCEPSKITVKPNVLERPKAHQLYKSLQCFLYQCSEGDVPADPLFKELDTVANNLALNIVAESPEYKSAKWA